MSDSAAEKWPLVVFDTRFLMFLVMAYAMLSWLQDLWPFSIRKTDGDLKASDGLVHGLSIPDQTKQFVFAVRDPETQAVIYLLDAQNLSEQTSV
ncbi:hypothetical protein MRB53_032668 [Persea americana]|uniref:Uncharacterized protein n=1 Tax=Persea americana TaxID=3435 RepID=A0ACC2KSR2_PERAE|nr:hypothetical protein MRB53_032668 [Persea americana]